MTYDLFRTGHKSFAVEVCDTFTKCIMYPEADVWSDFLVVRTERAHYFKTPEDLANVFNHNIPDRDGATKPSYVRACFRDEKAIWGRKKNDIWMQ